MWQAVMYRPRIAALSVLGLFMIGAALAQPAAAPKGATREAGPTQLPGVDPPPRPKPKKPDTGATQRKLERADEKAAKKSDKMEVNSIPLADPPPRPRPHTPGTGLKNSAGAQGG